jgi:V8-like Glu-specific endopeptidase
MAQTSIIHRSCSSLETLAVALVLSFIGAACYGEPEDPNDAASQVDLSQDGHDLEESSAYEEVAIDGVDSPLPDSDPRSVLEVDPHAVLIDPGFLPPPPEPSDLIEKWVRSPDDRKPVLDTTLAPQRMAVMLLVTLDGQTGPCSGVMVGPDAVLTSAHCLFNPSTQRWATKGTKAI